VSQRVYRGEAIDSCARQGTLQVTLDRLLVRVMPADDAAAWVARTVIGGEYLSTRAADRSWA